MFFVFNPGLNIGPDQPGTGCVENNRNATPLGLAAKSAANPMLCDATPFVLQVRAI